MFQSKKRAVFILSSAFFIFLLSSVFITYPLVFNLSNFTTGFGDELLISWIQNWIIHSLNNPLSIFDTNIFYPYQNTLAYSDLFIASSLFAAIPLKIFHEPIVAFNFTLISSLGMLGLSVFLLSYYLTKNFVVSVISGLLVIFSPAVLDKKVHLQILAIYPVPLSMLFFLHFIKTKKAKFLSLSMLFFIVQTYNSFLPGYFLIFFFVISLALLFFRDKKLFNYLLKPRILLQLLLVFLILLPIVIPYYKVSWEFNYKRDIRDSIHFALQPEDLLVTSEYSRLQKVLPQNFKIDRIGYGEIKPGFIGLIFSILSLAFVIFSLKFFRKKDFTSFSLFITGIVGLITSLGPALHLGRVVIHEPFPVILPYALFYYLLPGFSGFRNSARWEMLFIICFSVGIGIMLSEILKKHSKIKSLAICFILIIGIVVEFNFPMKYYKVPRISEFPKVYNYIGNLNSPSIFIPICNWNDKCSSEEFKRLYFSTIGFPRMVNGASGFSPPPWEKTTSEINTNFPNKKSLLQIKSLGVKQIVFEKETYNKYFEKEKSKKVLGDLNNNKKLRLIKKFDNTYVFEL